MLFPVEVTLTIFKSSKNEVEKIEKPVEYILAFRLLNRFHYLRKCPPPPACCHPMLWKDCAWKWLKPALLKCCCGMVLLKWGALRFIPAGLEFISRDRPMGTVFLPAATWLDCVLNSVLLKAGLRASVVKCLLDTWLNPRYTLPLTTRVLCIS